MVVEEVRDVRGFGVWEIQAEQYGVRGGYGGGSVGSGELGHAGNAAVAVREGGEGHGVENPCCAGLDCLGREGEIGVVVDPEEASAGVGVDVAEGGHAGGGEGAVAADDDGEVGAG